MSEEGESVQVAVRMRVFNRRETDAGSERIIRMERQTKGSNTYITNPDASGDERKFNFDYSFQSHSTSEPGIGDFASQDNVFEDLGRPVMEGALEGRNVCLFAYGQTGAGKSYSMLGKPEEPGIIPRTCNAIFAMIEAESGGPYEYTVDIQVVEIYCEQINDLLCDRKRWPPTGHKPRLTDRGYVVDTVRKPCFKYPDIESAFNFADRNRSVGSHALNPESSRAHTIYTINYERRKRHSSGKIVETVTSQLNLVDLAGSERTAVAQTTGQMLKEGTAINLSLTALGSCIKALSERKRPNYRDSKLTLLLQGSMTNGKVVMIAAVSPSAICYDESMSTLRFAERIKQVKIRVSKNVTSDPVAELKKAMEEMRERMQAEIEALRQSGDPNLMTELEKRVKEQQEGTESMKEAYERRMREMEESSEERVRRAQEITSMQASALGGALTLKKEDIKDPHLLNLHEDTRLAETLVYALRPGRTVIGRTNKESPPDLEFNGMGIVKNHCVIVHEENKVELCPGRNSRCLVNGRVVDRPVELTHNARVWLGNNYAFRFSFPGREEDGEKLDEIPDYYMAEAEIAENTALELAGGTEGIPTELNHKLSEALKRVEQANIIASDLKKGLEFEAKITKNRLTGDSEVVVRVVSPSGESHWPWEKFTTRMVDFVRQWQQWQRAEETGQPYVPPPKAEDPFVDTDYQLLGEADVWLQSLSNLIEHEADVSMLSVTGAAEGRLRVSLRPFDRNGTEGPWPEDSEDDPFVDEPQELLGRDITFSSTIHGVDFDPTAWGAPADSNDLPYRDLWIRYRLGFTRDDDTFFRTPEISQGNRCVTFEHREVHNLRVDGNALAALQNGRIIYQLWGKLNETAPHTNTRRGGGKRTEAARLDAEIAEKRRTLVDLQKQITDAQDALRTLRGQLPQ